MNSFTLRITICGIFTSFVERSACALHGPPSHVTLFAVGAIGSLCSQCRVAGPPGALHRAVPHWYTTAQLASGVGSLEKLRVLQRVAFFDAGWKLRRLRPSVSS